VRHSNTAVIPANAGIHSFEVRVLGQRSRSFKQWIPAFAGMTISLPCLSPLGKKRKLNSVASQTRK